MIGGVPEDGGRQFDRTMLAWARTGLVFTVTALLLARGVERPFEPPVVGAAAVVSLALATAVVLVRTQRLARRPAAAEARPWVMGGLVVAVLILQAAAVVAVV